MESAILISIEQDDLRTGLLVAGAVDAYRQKHNLVTPPVDRKLIDAALTQARQQLPPAEATAAWAAGAAMTLEAVLTYYPLFGVDESGGNRRRSVYPMTIEHGVHREPIQQRTPLLIRH
ncbi:MAG: hypothetical protein R3A44_21985 [Caldilineaceae bacterium]